MKYSFGKAIARLSVTAKTLVSEKAGATAIEYGLIAGLVAVVIIGAVSSVGTNAASKFTAVADNLK